MMKQVLCINLNKLIPFLHPVASCRKCFSVESLFLCPVFNHPLLLANCSSGSDVFFPFSCDITYLNHMLQEETRFWFGQIIFECKYFGIQHSLP